MSLDDFFKASDLGQLNLQKATVAGYTNNGVHVELLFLINGTNLAKCRAALTADMAVDFGGRLISEAAKSIPSKN